MGFIDSTYQKAAVNKHRFCSAVVAAGGSSERMGEKAFHSS
jgi:hypothetical protein